MSSDLLSIAKSGAKAARVSLDVTAQNIANASTEGYVRRTVALKELAGVGSLMNGSQVTLAGVRVDAFIRNADAFRLSEVRRTTSDAVRAGAEVSGLESIETAVETADVYSAVVDFEAALQQLAADPNNGALRALTMEQGNTLASSFNVAMTGLDTAGEGMRFQASDSVAQVNKLSEELARVNQNIARTQNGSADQASMLDRRDLLLQSLSEFADISTSFDEFHRVEVHLGSPAGPVLVSGNSTATMAMATAADGTISFTVGGGAVAVGGGSLAGNAQALVKLADVKTNLDSIATNIMTVANDAQANGVDQNGATGAPMFSGTGAGDMKMAMSSGAAIATAPAGAGAGSRDAANLTALRNALTSANPAGGVDGILYDVSSSIAGRKISRDTLETIASNAQAALQAQAGVDIDQEAVNLVRFQQAFQASGRVMQVASDIFDTLLSIR